MGRSLNRNEWLQKAIFAVQQTKRQKALVQKVDPLAENAMIFETVVNLLYTVHRSKINRQTFQTFLARE